MTLDVPVQTPTSDESSRLGTLAGYLANSGRKPTLLQRRRLAKKIDPIRLKLEQEFQLALRATENRDLAMLQVVAAAAPPGFDLAAHPEIIRAGARTDGEGALNNPWIGRDGWSTEEPIPINWLEEPDPETGKTRKVPEERGYVVFNELVEGHHCRPFRTAAGEPRVAVPVQWGLEVRNPKDRDGSFVDFLGYNFWSRYGRRVPVADLRSAATCLQERALSGDLEQARVVDLAIRVACSGADRLLDLNDRRRRCVRVTAGEWVVESHGHPVFDSPAHMAELPQPRWVGPPTKGWTRVNALFDFVRVATGEDGGDSRLLVLAELVQFIVAPGSPKPITFIIAPEGSGKTSMAIRLQQTVDPSLVPTNPVPKKPEHLVDLAFNRQTVNLDNVSHIPPWLSDDLARLCTGAGLAKRELYSNRGEVIANRIPWILVNGITPDPEMADLIRRAFFVPVLPPGPGQSLGQEELASRWQEAHPDILGGLLDLCVLVLRVREGADSPPSSSSDMADFTRIGRETAIAMGRPMSDFDAAWTANLAAQNEYATANPWVVYLAEQFTDLPRGSLVSAAELARRVADAHKELRGVTSQIVGNQIARCKTVLERMGIPIERSRVGRGGRSYFLGFLEKGGSGGVQSKLPIEKQVATPLATPSPPDFLGDDPPSPPSPPPDNGLANPPGTDSPTENGGGRATSPPAPPISLKPPSGNGSLTEERENWTVPPKSRAHRREGL